MARGWESKSVGDQMAEAEERRRVATAPKLSATELTQRERITNLQLAQFRLREQLGRARSEVHKHSLARALADIEAQLKR